MILKDVLTKNTFNIEQKIIMWIGLETMYLNHIYSFKSSKPKNSENN